MERLTFAELRRSTHAIVHNLLAMGAHVPIIGQAVMATQTARFNASRGNTVRRFNGVYPNFAAAESAVPAGSDIGYDNEPSAGRLLNEWLTIEPADYPILFWLERLLPKATQLFDWGGNVGLKYFAFQKYLSYPPTLIWCVSDVPAVVAAGIAIAQRHAATALRFTTSLDALPDADILLASGTIHFIECPLEMLGAARALPAHVLLNKVPVYDHPAAVTLQNMGTAFCPNHLFNRSQLVQSFTDLGYRLVDEWKTPEVICEIPFHQTHSIYGYSGFYFCKDAQGNGTTF